MEPMFTPIQHPRNRVHAPRGKSDALLAERPLATADRESPAIGSLRIRSRAAIRRWIAGATRLSIGNYDDARLRSDPSGEMICRNFGPWEQVVAEFTLGSWGWPIFTADEDRGRRPIIQGERNGDSGYFVDPAAANRVMRELQEFARCSGNHSRTSYSNWRAWHPGLPSVTEIVLMFGTWEHAVSRSRIGRWVEPHDE